jgi:SpoVK/Ycf46/Vps4 family AAA+-type ATPase
MAADRDDPKAQSEVAYDLRRPALTFDSLILPKDVSDQIEQAVALYRERELIFETWGLKSLFPQKHRMVLNFFGPPGTGKTHCAEALAASLGLEYLSVNYATMESKFVGETAKNIVAVFRYAARRKVLMHWDEADTILGKRLTHVSQSTDHAVNTARTTMLIEIERHDGPVVFGTNLITNYDKAFERRIDAFIEFRLPSEVERTTLLKKMLPRALPRDAGLSMEAAAALTDGFSPADLRKLFLLAAARMALKKTNRALTNEVLAAAIDDVRRGKMALVGEVRSTIEAVSPADVVGGEAAHSEHGDHNGE